MEIELYLNKDINQNADVYFSKAKKQKNKVPGLEIAINKTQEIIDNFEDKKKFYVEKKKREEKLDLHIKKEWYEKFRFTFSKSGFLCVAGKDSGTNEILIKKHMEENDIIIHTQASGSPFCLIKNSRNKIPQEEIFEVAQFVCCFSKQWKGGYGTADAFWVYPEQVSKKAQSGEYIQKGSFMIRGEKNILKNVPLQIALGVEKKKIELNEETIEYEELFSGPINSVKNRCGQRFIKIEPGQQTYKSLNKEIKKRLKTHVEDLPKYIPNYCKILKK